MVAASAKLTALEGAKAAAWNETAATKAAAVATKRALGL